MENGFIETFPNRERFIVFNKSKDLAKSNKDKQFTDLKSKNANQAKQIKKLKKELKMQKPDSDDEEEDAGHSAFAIHKEKKAKKEKLWKKTDKGFVRVTDASDSDEP